MLKSQRTHQNFVNNEYMNYSSNDLSTDLMLSDMSFDSLPFDIFFSVVTFLDCGDIDDSLKLTCKSVWKSCHSKAVWRYLCMRTGKICPQTETKDLKSTLFSLENHTNPNHSVFRTLYYCIPCVPIDFPTIFKALKHRHVDTKNITVTLMPGTYYERIDIQANSWSTQAKSSKTITIRAAFPDRGAALIYHEPNEGCSLNNRHHRNQSCVNIYSRDNFFQLAQGDENVDVNLHPFASTVHISHLQLLHYSPGTDIWGGNCVVRVDGHNVYLSMHKCTLQSDSGRGLVVTTAASVYIQDSVIHDCAATGLYIGDLGSQGIIRRCNIIRNGGGSRFYPNLQGSRADDTDEVSLMSRDEMGSNIEDDDPFMFEDDTYVPPGHSGMYVETGMAILDDSLLAANSLTGLSVVRGGSVKLCNCDIIGNGTEPFSIEDANDANRGVDDRRLGGIIDLGCNRIGKNRSNDTTNGSSISYESLVRSTPFPITSEYMTVNKLDLIYSKNK